MGPRRRDDDDAAKADTRADDEDDVADAAPRSVLPVRPRDRDRDRDRVRIDRSSPRVVPRRDVNAGAECVDEAGAEEEVAAEAEAEVA